MFADPDGELRGTVTADSLQRVLDHYIAGDWRADRALITGDLIQDDSKEAYDLFRQLLIPLKMRMHCVPGNHDVRDLMRPICSRPPFSYCAKEEVRDWLLVGLDSCISGEAGGEIACPPEDFGRAFQSMQALHGEIEWDHPGYDPEAFDPKLVSFEPKKAVKKRR